MKIRNDGVVAAFFIDRRTHGVVDFLAAVNRQDHIGHFAVQILDIFIVQQKAVGRHGEAEILSVGFLPFSAVANQLFYHIEIHHGFAAEKVDF